MNLILLLDFSAARRLVQSLSNVSFFYDSQYNLMIQLVSYHFYIQNTRFIN
jgi:hypothetical protein